MTDMEPFYNTINIKGVDIAEAVKVAMSQDDKILFFLKRNPDKLFTPFDIHDTLFDSKTPITSIRRAMTNLTKSGKIEKVDKQEMEKFGKPNYQWRLAKEPRSMDIEHEIKLRYETFVYFDGNATNDELAQCKKGNDYFLDIPLQRVCELIIKMQKVMFKILPPTNHEHHQKQFNRMNDLVRICKETLTDIEKQKT